MAAYIRQSKVCDGYVFATLEIGLVTQLHGGARGNF